MKHLKKFEDFDFGRFDDEFDAENTKWMEDDVQEIEDLDDEIQDEEELESEEEAQEEQEEHRIRRWGDEEIVEKKKMNPGFKAYLDKQKSKKEDKDGKEDEKPAKKDDKAKGLSKAQQKLPKALQDAIAKKRK